MKTHFSYFREAGNDGILTSGIEVRLNENAVLIICVLHAFCLISGRWNIRKRWGSCGRQSPPKWPPKLLPSRPPFASESSAASACTATLRSSEAASASRAVWLATARRGIPNPTSRTCWVASTLQALFAASTASAIARHSTQSHTFT